MIDAPGIAQRHAEIVFRADGSPSIRASSPDAALFVNGRLVDSAVLLAGDTVQLGTVVARVIHDSDRSWSEVAPGSSAGSRLPTGEAPSSAWNAGRTSRRRRARRLLPGRSIPRFRKAGFEARTGTGTNAGGSVSRPAGRAVAPPFAGPVYLPQADAVHAVDAVQGIRLPPRAAGPGRGPEGRRRHHPHGREPGPGPGFRLHRHPGRARRHERPRGRRDGGRPGDPPGRLSRLGPGRRHGLAAGRRPRPSSPRKRLSVARRRVDQRRAGRRERLGRWVSLFRSRWRSP
ncbi:MAG: FHA domain-containing protein [Holophagales bacterium]|nr:FHA domain-containing protein [Holophagales bacterium]